MPNSSLSKGLEEVKYSVMFPDQNFMLEIIPNPIFK